MKIKYYENDLPENLDLGGVVAIDTETMGLNPSRDRLCLVQYIFLILILYVCFKTATSNRAK